MSETQRAWYQCGWTMFLVVFVICPAALFVVSALYQDWQKQQLPSVVPQIAAYVDQPMFATPSFKVMFWHQHTERLRNGRVGVVLTSEMVSAPDGRECRMHSYEAWEANRDNAVTLSLPLKYFDPNLEMSVFLSFSAKNARPYSCLAKWRGDNWVSESLPSRN